MSPKERVLALRLKEKLDRRPHYGETVGVTVTVQIRRGEGCLPRKNEGVMDFPNPW